MSRPLLLVLCVCLLCACGSGHGGPVDPKAPLIVQAAQRGDLATVKQLLAENPAALTVTDSKNNTAAAWAILNDHDDIAVYLIEHGYPVNPRTGADVPLILDCTSRFTPASDAMLQYLLQHGADPNVLYTPEHWRALDLAVNNGMENKVRLLVQHGADLHATNASGQTPLQLARDRLAQFRDPTFNFPHGELSDPKVRSAAIDRWRHMVTLLEQLDR
jgi:ankyrin repeat protein